ncbi:helix-turn-helix domain-containing protein [Candidatus Formimonas warabiya]|uniref:Insertion element IS150 protein InsJ-like helix-turn-helix domain-containing protein n=1 Tax=Formimonas warabiya TaxID=1761012 RepID=A0A3G1KT11_FORW1|nr:helix-turn-helix domain-containing protein [Candidatus Formimonas warabiya]ATW25622.1 hypothetical protein DCMF_13400 [Candidatus Formimonas warabiya]
MPHRLLSNEIQIWIPKAKNDNTEKYEVLQQHLQKYDKDTLLKSMYFSISALLNDKDRLEKKLADEGSLLVEYNKLVESYNQLQQETAVLKKKLASADSLAVKYKELVESHSQLLNEKQSLKDKLIRLLGDKNISGRIQRNNAVTISKILELQSKGLTDNEICAELGISRKTIYNRKKEYEDYCRKRGISVNNLWRRSGRK